MSPPNQFPPTGPKKPKKPKKLSPYQVARRRAKYKAKKAAKLALALTTTITLAAPVVSSSTSSPRHEPEPDVSHPEPLEASTIFSTVSTQTDDESTFKRRVTFAPLPESRHTTTTTTAHQLKSVLRDPSISFHADLKKLSKRPRPSSSSPPPSRLLSEIVNTGPWAKVPLLPANYSPITRGAQMIVRHLIDRPVQVDCSPDLPLFNDEVPSRRAIEVIEL